jgi:hypothetical protein
MRKRFLLAAGVFGVAIVAASFNFGGNKASATVPGVNTLISVNNTGNGQGGNNDSNISRLSADGKYVAFSSWASNIVSGDTNNKGDVFVRNIAAGTTTRISTSTTGLQSDADSLVSAISQTGRYVLFMSTASNLIAGATMASSPYQLYLRDTQLGTTTLVTKNALGTAGNFVSGSTVLGYGVSNDGRFVLFASNSTNLGPTVTNNPYTNLYMADMVLNTMTILNTPTSGSFQNLHTNSAAMSCDGSIVTFASDATNLVAGDTNALSDVFILDRRTGDRLTSFTQAANDTTYAPQISCNGNYIGFFTKATNLASGITDGKSHLVTYDRVAGSYDLIDQSTGGILSNGFVQTSDRSPQLSDSGDVVFASSATNLSAVAIPYMADVQVYVRNKANNTTEMISVIGSSSAGNYSSSSPRISADGRVVTYETKSTNLVASDTNSKFDIFMSPTGF